jgi:integrase
MEEKIADYSKLLESTIEKVKTSPISSKNKSLILGFIDECFAEGLSKGRAIKYAYYLLRLAEWLGKDFKTATKEDLKELLRKIEMSSYAVMTKMELKTSIKKLYKWIEDADEYPDTVRWIRPRSHGAVNKTRLPDEILTQDEVLRMIQSTHHPRDRALLSVLYETGARIGEILFLRLRAIEFDKNGAKVSIPHFGKTGSRRVRIISSVPYLQEWYNKHPDRENPDAYFWTGPRLECLKYGAIRSLLKRLAAKAKIRKPVNPHAFRHARATHLACHLTESQMKIYFGWTQASEMAATYVHLSGRDVDDAILKLHGVQSEEKQNKEENMSPKVCFRCHLENPATNSLCTRCGLPLDEKAATESLKSEMEQEKTGALITQVLQDAQFRDMLMKKIGELPKQ